MMTKRLATSTVGAVLVAASGAIHLHLWQEGYRYLPVIGPLFLLQAVSAFVLAAGVVATRRRLLLGVAALLLVGTAGGYLLDTAVGMFGFRDSLANGWGQASLVVEAAGAVVLTVGSVGHAPRSGRGHGRAEPKRAVLPERPRS